MKRFAKIILFVVGGVAALFVTGLVGINLYLQSGDVQQRIRLVTAEALGTPVSVNRTFYTPWGGLTLSGLSLPDPTVSGANLVNAPKFSVRFEFLPLLGKKFVISEVSLASPHLVLRQTADRRWVLLPPRPPKPAPEKPATAERPAAKPEIRLPNYSVELRRYRVEDGRAEMIDRKGAVVGRLSGLSVVGTVTADHLVQGDLEIDNLEIGEQIFPHHLRAHFEQRNREHLAVTDLRCSLADGKIHAELHVVTKRGAPPEFYLTGDVKGVSIPKLIADGNGNDAGTTGELNGVFQLRGNPLEARSLLGHGDFSLDSAQLRPWDFIQQIGLILRVDELQMLKLHQATLRIDVKDQRVWLTDVTLRTENLVISGRGPIKFDGKMSLDGRLMVNEKIQRELGSLLSDNFTPSEDANYKQVTFKISGRVDRPKTDLIEKVTGIQLGNVGGMLKGFFGAPKAAPEPTPASN